MQQETTELAHLEPTAKILAATTLSQSLSFCMERKYLQHIASKDAANPFTLQVHEATAQLEPMWIKISQVGRPLNKIEDCFTAIQKILYACFLPHQTQLLFMIVGDGVQNQLYLGVRAMDIGKIKPSFMARLNDFVSGVWPGLSTAVVNAAQDPNLAMFADNCSEKGSYDCFYAVTGIPSMASQYKTTYPATIDKLMAGMTGKKFAYLVVADPIDEEAVDGMLHTCREMNGQAESLKTFNFAEGIGEQKGQSQSWGTSRSESVSKQDSIMNMFRENPGKAGVTLAATVIPALAVMANNVNPAFLMVPSMAANVSSLLGAAPRTRSTTTGSNESFSTNYSQSQSQTLSRNIVNKHVEAISDHLFYHSQRLETGKANGMWKVGVYLMAEKEADLLGGALQLRSILSGQESIFEPIRLHDISRQMNSNAGNNRLLREVSLTHFASPHLMVVDSQRKCFAHPLGNNFQELKTVLTTKELSYLINFPLRSVPGVSVIDSSPEFSLNPQKESAGNGVTIGALLYGGATTKIPYTIPLSTLARHTLLSGINGSGKTNTVQAILNSLQQQLPYLVIEPAKTEYVDWALSYNAQHPDHPIDIYIPGCKVFRSKVHPEGFTVENTLKINPFEIVWLNESQQPNVLTHIDRLKSTFAAAFPMYDILPVLMEDLIYTVYQNKSTDWLNTVPQYGKTLPPTLNGMRATVDRVIANRQYEERIERNMKACLNTRIDSLMRGWKGEMLNTLHSTPWQTLFDRPCVINLSYVGDDCDKSFFMALILQFLYEYRTACVENGQLGFDDNACRHLTVIEEAHRVMTNCTNPDMPQYKTAMMFANMLSEIRAYGEGLLLVDQVPTRLIPDAIKNTNLKITHRLVAEDDCKAVGEAMGLTVGQRRIISKLQTGQAIFSGAEGTEAYWVKVNKSK